MINTLGRIAIIILIVIGIIAVLYAVTSVLGVQIPQIVITCAWIVLAVAIGVLVIKYLVSLGGGSS